VISTETAQRQAEQRKYTLRDEVRILLVHGLLHLLGYDHETNREDYIEVCHSYIPVLILRCNTCDKV